MASASSLLDCSQMIEIFDLLKCSGFSARKFHELGLRLGLLKRTLDAIEMDKMGDPDESLRECLSKWLDRVDNVDIKGGATIDSLSNALRAMGETAVSDKIDQKKRPHVLAIAIFESHRSFLSDSLSDPLELAKSLLQENILAREAILNIESASPSMQSKALLDTLKDVVRANHTALQQIAVELCKHKRVFWKCGQDILKKYGEYFDIDPRISAYSATEIDSMKKNLTEKVIELTVTRITMHGPPGSGKTCTQGLLLNEDLPPVTNDDSSASADTINNSTSAACRAIRATRVSVDEDDKWNPISKEKLRDRLLCSLRAELRKQHDGENEMSLEEPQGSEIPRSNNNMDETSSRISDSETPEENEFENNDDELNFLISEYNPQSNIELKDRWVYIIDSGGQLAYQELLPLFTRAPSLNIITLDLSRPFNKEFDFTYRINGKEFSCNSTSSSLDSFKSAVSSGIIFKHPELECSVKSESPSSMHLVLGTHFDRVKYDLKKVSRFESDLSKSLSQLHCYFSDCIISVEGSDKLVFPINTTDREKRAEYSKKICQAIRVRGEDCSLRIELPLRWFAFELVLPEKNFITLEEAYSAGERCKMSPEDTIKALKYFHAVTLFLYYPEVKPSIVFLDPQPILDILSHLLAITYVCGNNDALDAIVSKSLSQINDINSLKEGFFQKDIFDKLKSGNKLFDSNFKSSYLIDLLLHLKIITKVPDKYVKGHGDYFIPYALPSYSAKSSSDSASTRSGLILPIIEKDHAKKICMLYWKMEKNQILPVPQGIFPLTIMHLLNFNLKNKEQENQKQYEIQMFPPHGNRYRDAMSLWIFNDKEEHELHLINRYTHIEVYFLGPKEHCSKVREIIEEAICDSSHAINVDTDFLYPAFEFDKCLHVITDGANKKIYCTKDSCSTPNVCRCSDLNDNYWCWFSDSTSSTPSGEENTKEHVAAGTCTAMTQKSFTSSGSEKVTQLNTAVTEDTDIPDPSASLSSSCKWSKLGITCVVGLVILFGLVGYLAFYYCSILGAVIYGLVLLVVFAGYLVFIWKSIQGLIIYGLVVLGLMLLFSAEIFFIWNSILRIMVFGAFIAVFFWIAIITWINGGDVTKVQPLLLALVPVILTPVVTLVLKNLSDPA